jgi:hypothetical protein
MKTVQKMGGLAALIEAAAYIFGIAVGFTVLTPYMDGQLNPLETVAFMVENQSILYIWNQIIYVLFGIVLVVLALALYQRLQKGSPALSQTAAVFGFIWAGLVIASGMIFNISLETVVGLAPSAPEQAAAILQSVSVVQDAMGGGNEIVGGVWVLLITWAALSTGGLPKLLNYYGLLIGLAGAVTIVPGLGDVGLIFGLGQILWFIGVGVALLRSPSGEAV